MAVHSLARVVLAAHDPPAAARHLAVLLGGAHETRIARADGCRGDPVLMLANTRLAVVGATSAGRWGEAAAHHLEAVGEGLLGFVFGALPGGVSTLTGPDGWLPAEVSRGVPVQCTEQPFEHSRGAPAPSSDAMDAVDHVVVRSSSADDTRRLFGEQLGIRVALDRRFENFGARMIFCRVSSLSVEIVSPLTEEAGTGPDRLDGLAFRVGDAERAVVRLASAGFGPDPVRDGRKPGTRVSTLRRAPLGLRVLVIQQPGREHR